MSVTVDHHSGGDLAVVSLDGEHDIGTATAVRRALADLTGASRVVVLDLATCRFMDSTILGAFAGAAKRMSAAGSHLVAINAHGIVARTLQITKMDALLSPGSVVDAEYAHALRELMRDVPDDSV